MSRHASLSGGVRHESQTAWKCYNDHRLLCHFYLVVIEQEQQQQRTGAQPSEMLASLGIMGIYFNGVGHHIPPENPSSITAM